MTKREAAKCAARKEGRVWIVALLVSVAYFIARACA